ncbi:type II toxin-antitoxin system VapB family antitoxin [Paracoccus ravus]|uniref:type II toxin-antitoxin system VapB family antitoxin n=1 Tax=Paracoccus ravus TaxID=2447760 RepID=UPI001430EECE|nr:type II toxin-antitoxin system VapB family antitoxin [Paracoccus ravus]
MPLYTKAPDIDALVARYLAMTGTKDKTAAVREVFAAQIAALSARESLESRVTRIQRRAALAGILPDGNDDKAFMDEIWGEE